MSELTSPLTLFLLINSFLATILILNQNESSKESLNQKSLIINPFEKFTWVSLFIQLILLLIKTKVTDF